jgi:hypothetical protein
LARAATSGTSPEIAKSGILFHMAFVVQAHTDDHTLSATTETATDTFAKAVEWQAVHKFAGVTISDGVRSFSIAEFASAMASLDIANTLDATSGRGPKVRG